MAARKKSAREGGDRIPTPAKPWGTKTGQLPQYAISDLRQVYYFLGKDTRERLGLTMKIPVFITDPLVALGNPALGVQEIEVRLEIGFGDGPTSSRIEVWDYDASTGQLIPPVVWDPEVGWFRTPEGEWLPEAPQEPRRRKDPEKDPEYQAAWRAFVESATGNPYFHQVNAWAIVERVLEFYQEPQALGRPIPWGFDGNRLIVRPHANYGQNAYYDRNSKSLLFYYYGDPEHRGYTCLSHDIITHETAHAVLDGIRPLYGRNTSLQTAAFHEFIGDLTAIMLALFNKDISHFVARTTQGDFRTADVLANLAEQFGREVAGRPYLRTARNDLTMESVRDSAVPHEVSQVLTGAMFDILVGIGEIHAARNAPAPVGETPEGAAASDAPQPEARPARTVTPAQIVARSADRFRRVALQPLDLCPPCDIQFVDYAAAVLRNDLLTNPVDTDGYRRVMLDVFHARGLCACGYESGKDLPRDCRFQAALRLPELELVYHDIGSVSRSRTAAYNFLSDNRRPLRIPRHVDVNVCDLYDNGKLGAAAERLPREVVLEYVWQEAVVLQNEAGQNLDFGEYEGRRIFLDCGGTLVFDERGNLLSWFHKPGTEHIRPEWAQELRAREELIRTHPDEARAAKVRLTKQERGELEDLAEGEQRKAALLAFVADAISRGTLSELGITIE